MAGTTRQKLHLYDRQTNKLITRMWNGSRYQWGEEKVKKVWNRFRSAVLVCDTVNVWKHYGLRHSLNAYDELDFERVQLARIIRLRRLNVIVGVRPTNAA